MRAPVFGEVEPTNRKIVWSEAIDAAFIWLICLWMMYLNSPQSIVPGTKNFFLSMSGRSERAAFSQITGIRSGYFARILRDSALRFSSGTCSCRKEGRLAIMLVGRGKWRSGNLESEKLAPK